MELSAPLWFRTTRHGDRPNSDPYHLPRKGGETLYETISGDTQVSYHLFEEGQKEHRDKKRSWVCVRVPHSVCDRHYSETNLRSRVGCLGGGEHSSSSVDRERILRKKRSSKMSREGSDSLQTQSDMVTKKSAWVDPDSVGTEHKERPSEKSRDPEDPPVTMVERFV